MEKNLKDGVGLDLVPGQIGSILKVGSGGLVNLRSRNSRLAERVSLRFVCCRLLIDALLPPRDRQRTFSFGTT